MYEGYYVSHYLGKLQSIRSVDAAQLFPPQLTSTAKKLIKANGNGNGKGNSNGHKSKEKVLGSTSVVGQPKLLQKKAAYVAKSKKG
jgi:hypothetical protein